MKRTLRFLYLLVCMLVMSISANADIIKQGGWFESAYAEWAAVSDATDYKVYVKKSGGNYTPLEKELVRKYPSYFRADAVGLAAGTYQMKVVPVISGAEDASKAMETSELTVTAHDRNGFAHYNRSEGVGAYNNDGTLKANARVLYVYADNAETVSLEMQVDSKGTMSTRTGLQDIIQAYEKGQEKRPLAVRIIGTIKDSDMDYFGSSAEGLQVKGNGSAKCIANLTIEGIGEDAAIHGFGILCRSISSVEFRNFAIMACMDDCLSLDTDNKNIWIHNMDLFYGKTGGDADQAKGDGTVDIKGLSSHVTVSYNHFFDSGKCSLGGMKSETTDCWMTYHHNWFDHSDSRHPRIRTAFYHVYNNYFDGNAKYGVGVTYGGSAFVESNYFRNCKYPMLISKQGTDAQGAGTFSGEAGGVIKAFNNHIANPKQLLYYNGNQTDGVWDAVKANSREENVTATAFTGGTSYNNAATTAAIAAVPASAVNDPQDVPDIVRGNLGAGRMNHGDVDWKFNNAIEDANYGVIADLKSAVVSYQSTLVGFADGTSIKNGGATSTVVGGNGQGISQEVNDAVVPTWGAGGDVEEADFEEEPFIASADDDMFWVGENAAQTNAYIADGTITITNGTATNKDGVIPTSKFNTDYAGNDTYPAEHNGSLQLGQASASGNTDGGYATFYCPKGVTSFKINTLRTGTTYYQVQKSTDGQNFTTVSTVTKAAAGILTKDFSMAVRNTESKDPVWIRVVNCSTGGLNIHGIYICQLPTDAVTLQPSDLTVSDTEKSINIGESFKVAYTTSSTGAVSYSTSNNKVATVDAEGNVTAVSEGTCNITVSQAKDDTYKAGAATIQLTVSDPRTASTLALISEATVSLKDTETSQIAISGAAGAVTYASSNSGVATVSNTGLITAVSVGSATITVSDAGSENVKGGSVSVSVTVTKDMTGKTLVTFTFDGKNPVTCSDPTLVGLATANGKNGLSVSYNGATLTQGVKMESATTINITPPSNATVIVVFDVASKKFKLDDNSYTTDANGQYSFNATGGTTYVLKKGDSSMNLVAVLFDFGNGDNTGGGDEGGEGGEGGNTGGGDEGGDENSVSLIDYQHEATATTGITISGTTVIGSAKIHTDSETVNGIKLANGYTTDGVVNNNYIKLQVEGGFKKGDVVAIAGFYNNKDNKESAATIFIPNEDGTPSTLWTSGQFINGRTNSLDPAVQTYTLEKDCDVLYIGRTGNTTTYIYSLTVTRPMSTDGGSTTGITVFNTSATGAIYDLQGRRIAQPMKGQMYIVNGKKFIQK